MIREANYTDVDKIVSIHQFSFQGFFLSFLGDNFLRVLYADLIEMIDSISYVIIADNELIGFVVGTTSQSSAYRELLVSRWPAFARASLRAVIREPTIIPRLLRAVRMPGEANSATSDCLLMSMAIHPAYQGHSFGSQLMQAFLKKAKIRGSNAVSLTTDAVNNEAVNHFYQREGFNIARRFTTPEGRQMNEYIYEINRNSSIT